LEICDTDLVTGQQCKGEKCCKDTTYQQESGWPVLSIQFDPESKVKTVEEAILAHINMQTLAGPCGECGCKQMQKEYISKPSEMFVVQLNRTGEGGTKIDKAIDFEGHVKIKGEHLDPRIESASSHNILYELTAVILHSGASVDQGHYTIIVKGRTNKWTLIDDEKAIPITISDFCRKPQTQKDAYIFAYTRWPRQPTEERMIRNQRIYTVDRIEKRLQRQNTSLPSGKFRQPESYTKPQGASGKINLTSSPSVQSISSNTTSSNATSNRSRANYSAPAPPTHRAAAAAAATTGQMQAPPVGYVSRPLPPKDLKGPLMGHESFQMPVHCGADFPAPHSNKKGFLRVQYIEYEASSQKDSGKIQYEIPLDFAVRGYPINVKENPMETPLNSTLNTILKRQKSNEDIMSD
jgi:hypothetical protein